MQTNYGTGRRKTATARVFLKSGSGQITVNGKPLDNPVGLDWQGTSLLVVDSRAKQLFSITPDAKLAPVKLGN